MPAPAVAFNTFDRIMTTPPSGPVHVAFPENTPDACEDNERFSFASSGAAVRKEIFPCRKGMCPRAHEIPWATRSAVVRTGVQGRPGVSCGALPFWENANLNIGDVSRRTSPCMVAPGRRAHHRHRCQGRRSSEDILPISLGIRLALPVSRGGRCGANAIPNPSVFVRRPPEGGHKGAELDYGLAVRNTATTCSSSGLHADTSIGAAITVR